MTGRVLGIGTPLYDVIKFVSDAELAALGLIKGTTTFPEGESPAELEGMLGGSSTNVLKVISRCGIPCAVHGVIGDDWIGNRMESLLKQRKIEPLLTRIADSSSGVVTCYVTPDAERTMTPSLGASKEFSHTHLERTHFSGARHVHLEGYSAFSGEVLPKSLEYAKELKVTTSLDLASINVVEGFKESLLDWIADVDYLFGNRQEMSALTDESDMKKALEHFALSQTVIATDGASGSYVKAAGEDAPVHYPAEQVATCLDTTGAGDYYCGGFLSGVLQQKEMATCVKMGNVFASAVIQVQGAELPEADWQMLLKQIKAF